MFSFECIILKERFSFTSLVIMQNAQMDTPMMSMELRAYPVPEKLSSVTLSGRDLMSISGGSFEVYFILIDFLAKF